MQRNTFESNQISRAMRAFVPVETADTDAAMVWRQVWMRRDGRASRCFNVLALDEQMAEAMGGIRLKEKYDQSILDWRLQTNTELGRTTSLVRAVLMAEDPDEEKLRVDTYHERRGE